jgi:hypothetical protein
VVTMEHWRTLECERRPGGSARPPCRVVACHFLADNPQSVLASYTPVDFDPENHRET